MATYSSSSKPYAGYVKPSENEHTYFIELFGELHFTENPPKPVTMSDLFYDFPMPKPSSRPQPVVKETITNEDQEEKKTAANDAPNDVPMPVEEQVKKATRPRRLTRSCLYRYPPVERVERDFPPPIPSLRLLYGDKAFPYCMEDTSALSHDEGGSSSSMEKGAFGTDDKPKM